MYGLRILAPTLLLAAAIAEGNSTATAQQSTYDADESAYQSNGYRWNGLRWNGLRWNGVDLHAADADSSVPLSFELNRVSVETDVR